MMKSAANYQGYSSSDDEDHNSSNAHFGSSTSGLLAKCRMKAVPCKNSRCDQELIFVNDDDLYCSRECYHVKLERDSLDEKGLGSERVQLKRLTIIGRGGTGLLRDGRPLDRLVIHVDSDYGRIVTVKKADKKDEPKIDQPVKPTLTKNKASSDDLIKKKQKKAEDKQRLKALLNCDVDDSDSESDQTTSSEDEEERAMVRNVPLSAVNSCICPPHPPLPVETGQKFRGYVINVTSPWDIYIQTGEMIKKTGEIELICNREQGIDSRLLVQDWLPQVGNFCCAKYEGVMYRALILGKVDGSFFVRYVDYGNTELVKEVYQLNPEVTLIPEQCMLFKVSNAKPKADQGRSDSWDKKVKQFTIEHLDGGVVDLEIEAVENGKIHWGKLHIKSSLSEEVKGDFGEALVRQGMAEPDTYYLDK